MRRALRRGFTLLEVLVAVTILGIGISAVLSSQWVSFAAVKHARLESEAVGLARCKMSEVEWDLTQNGYPLTDQEETGPCCDGEDNPRLTCTWKIQKPEFPQGNYGELNLDSDLDLGSGPSVLGGLASPGGAVPGGGALSFLKTGQAGMARQTGDVSDVADSFLGGGDGATDGIAALVMQIVYPDLKSLFEAGTRKVSVRVAWLEGSKEFSVDLEQWVTNSKEAGLSANLNGLLGDDEEDAATSSSTSSTGSGGGSRTPSIPSGTRGGSK